MPHPCIKKLKRATIAKNCIMKSIKCLLLILCSFIICSTAYAQDTSDDVIIILENGHKIHGKLLHYDPLKGAKISMGHGNEVFLDLKMIKRLETVRVVETPYRFKEKGFMSHAGISILNGSTHSGFSLNYEGMWGFHRLLSLGMGFGVDNYYSSEGYNIMPTFISVRSYLRAQDKTPFLYARTGYAWAFKDADVGQVEADGGLMWNIGAGFRLASGDTMFNIYSGIKVQKSDYLRTSGEVRISDDILFKRVEIGCGILF